MSDTEKTLYLDRLLKLYEEKLKGFRLSLILLLVGTTAFFFLIFFPYMTLLGNREDCGKKHQCTPIKESVLDTRISEVTISWGTIPISTPEVIALFPVGIACGFVAVIAQLQGLMRLRPAISQQVKALNNNMDVALIAPLLIDPKQSLVDQISGGITLISPFLIFLYSVIIILFRIEIIRNKLPYFQNTNFYRFIYYLSAFIAICSLVKLWCNYRQVKRFEKNIQRNN
jgi:hypothetical protein